MGFVRLRLPLVRHDGRRGLRARLLARPRPFNLACPEFGSVDRRAYTRETLTSFAPAEGVGTSHRTSGTDLRGKGKVGMERDL